MFDPDAELHDAERSALESAEFSGYENDGTPRGWLAAGSIREDDYSTHFYDPILLCPCAKNPASEIDRLFNHFFNVQGDSRGLPFSVAAPDWALGVAGRGAGSTQNHFTVLDAWLAQVRSLTAEVRADRDRSAATLFRTLGHVVHLLQDMAQPQHVRNDPHPACERSKLYSGEELV